MSSLVFVSQIGAIEGNLLTAHVSENQQVIFYHIHENRFYPDGLVPSNTWLDATMTDRGHVILSRFFKSLISDLNIDRIMALGIDAIIYANSVVDSHKIYPVIMKGELDFSVRRTGLLANFINAARNSHGLFFEDSWEMDKGSAHGSEKPHFTYPLFIQPNTPILNRTLDSPKIALIDHLETHNPDDEYRIDMYQKELEAAGFTVKYIKSKDLYSSIDLNSGRTFPATMRYRIGDCSHAVLIGDSRNSNSVLSGLSADADFIYVEDTFNTSIVLKKNAFHNAGHGIALINKLIKNVSSGKEVRERSTISISLNSPISSLESDFNYSRPWFFENVDGLSDIESFDLFFTVAPIENRANGARPQRIRNVAETMYASYPTVLVTSNAKLLRRKFAFIKWLIGEGNQPRFFYGENSTSPIATYDVICQLISLLDFLKLHGCRIGWFVRDLHWLDPEIGDNKLGSVTHLSTVARGLFELNGIAGLADVLFAPNEKSIQGFVKLIGDTNPVPFIWESLPPGTSRSNIWDEFSLATADEDDDAVTIVYSGGVGDVYNMDLFLSSIQQFDQRRYFFDFVIRENDRDKLELALMDHGLESVDSVRILHTDFHHYIPRTKTCIGVVLLNSDYANFSFPYKTVSLIEKGFPIVTFKDMAIADFVVQEGIGLSCERSPESIRNVIEMAVRDTSRFNFQQANRTNSWISRIVDMRKILSS